MIINRPVSFKGTKEEMEANRRTHVFEGIDYRCMVCDAKPWHAAADYPCGVEPPREDVEVRHLNVPDIFGRPSPEGGFTK